MGVSTLHPDALPAGTDAPGRLRVVLADDDPMVRRVLRDVLERADFEVVGTASTGDECVALVCETRPELAVVDLVMPGGDGIDTIRRIREAGIEKTALIVLTSSNDDDAAILALRAGAVGFLNKSVPFEELPRALRGALDGEAVISRRLSRRLIEQLRAAPEPGGIGVRPVHSPLSPREWEVLDLLCEGKHATDIADELVVSRETVRSHIKSILHKLSVNSQAEAIALAPALRLPDGHAAGSANT